MVTASADEALRVTVTLTLPASSSTVTLAMLRVCSEMVVSSSCAWTVTGAGTFDLLEVRVGQARHYNIGDILRSLRRFRLKSEQVEVHAGQAIFDVVQATVDTDGHLARIWPRRCICIPSMKPASTRIAALLALSLASGATHNSGTTIWVSGGTASAGVENVAELGSVGTLVSEIGRNANADVIVRAGSSFNTPTQTVSGTFTMKASHPLVSVLSMIAPTPDWFVGVSNLRLYDNGWQNRVVDLYPYDAGPAFTSRPGRPGLRGGHVDFDLDAAGSKWWQWRVELQPLARRAGQYLTASTAKEATIA